LHFRHKSVLQKPCCVPAAFTSSRYKHNSESSTQKQQFAIKANLQHPTSANRQAALVKTYTCALSFDK